MLFVDLLCRITIAIKSPFGVSFNVECVLDPQSEHSLRAKRDSQLLKFDTFAPYRDDDCKWIFGNVFFSGLLYA